MADDPTDETREKLAGYMTVALTGAARVAEVLAHQRTVKLRRAEQEGEQAARLVRNQQQAEAAMVRHQTRELSGRKEWWDTATVEQVADAYATARAWSPIDPELTGQVAFMAEEIRRRYGVDADQLVTDVEQNVRATRANREFAEAAVLVGEANVVETLVHADGVVTPREAAADLPDAAATWDEAGRRTALADRLTTAQIPADAAQARMVADQAEGRPATVTPAAHGHGKPPKARNVPTKGQERVRGR